MQPQTPASNRVATVPAPIGGLNARDSLIAMPEQDAAIFNNWWPQPYGVAVRRGYREWASGMPKAVETLATWPSPDGSQKLFAWSDFFMYDITNRGLVGNPILSGFSTSRAARWQTVIVSNDAGAHLICVNGADNAILYNVNGPQRITAGDGIAPLTWKGLNPTKAIQLTSHQGRVWATEMDTTKGWYLPVGAITGEWLSFDFGPQFKRGGALAFLSTWTIDDGNGAEDHLVAVSTNGEAVVYGGTDPSDDTKWTQVGVYFVGAPLPGRRSYAKVGADLMILSQKGVVSMSDLLSSTKINQSEEAIKTSQIQYLVASLTSVFVDYFGWQLIYYPPINQLLFNIPNPAAAGNRQLVSNQVIPSQPWATFTGQDAVCWGQMGLNPFFGDKNGRVLQAWQGNADDLDLGDRGGKNIVATVQQAYSYFGSPAVQKQVGMYRPNFVVSKPIALSSFILYDFSRVLSSIPNSIPKVVPNADLPSARWDIERWNQSIWGPSGSPGTPTVGAAQRQWIQANGLGVAAAIVMVVSSQEDVLWISTDYSYKVGTIL